MHTTFYLCIHQLIDICVLFTFWLLRIMLLHMCTCMYTYGCMCIYLGVELLVAQTVKSICLQCGRPGFDPWMGKIPGEGNGNPLQYCCLENPMDEGA